MSGIMMHTDVAVSGHDHKAAADTTSRRTPDDGDNTLRSLLYPTKFAKKGETATRFSPAFLWRNRVAVSTF